MNLKKFHLQKQLINEIEDYGGIEKLNTFMVNYRLKLDIQDRLVFININEYFNLLYRKDIDVSLDALRYKSVFQSGIYMVQNILIVSACSNLGFISKLLETIKESGMNVRLLA